MASLHEIFHPRAARKINDARQARTRFVHYCSAEGAYSILSGGTMWMRNASVMNDFREVEYGATCLDRALQRELWKLVLQRFEEAHTGFRRQILDEVRHLAQSLRLSVYLTSLSEHLDQEDEVGRLSMWRAYGAPNSVALVVNGEMFTNTSPALGCIPSPVEYASLEEFDPIADEAAVSLLSNLTQIGQLSREDLRAWCLGVALASMVCVKHPGFREEREWRIFHAPTLMRSQVLTQRLITLNGTPQAVFEIPLRDLPNHNYAASIPQLLDRVIVGPCRHPEVVAASFVSLLRNSGVHDALRRVAISDVPLRH